VTSQAGSTASASARPKADVVESHINANRVEQCHAARVALCVEFLDGVRRLRNGVVRGGQLPEVSRLVVISESK